MPLRFASEPKNATLLIRQGLNRLSTRESPLSGRAIDLSALQLTRPHAVYDLRADAVAAGGRLASASASGVRYLIEGGGNAIAAAEVHIDGTGNATLLANLNYGPYVAATARALTQIATLPAVSLGSYEVRLLRFSAIFLMTLWLKSNPEGTDIIYPLAPAPKGLQAEHPYSEDEFLTVIVPLAQERAAKNRSPAIP
jgi:hypothetical protein